MLFKSANEYIELYRSTLCYRVVLIKKKELKSSKIEFFCYLLDIDIVLRIFV